MIADLLYRVRALFRRSSVERDLDDELRSHIEYAVEKYVASGVSRAEAERRARLMFGGVDQIKEECRDSWGISLLQTVFQDLRYGVRAVRRAPLVAATVVVTIALSTGALAAVFTLGHTLFWRVFPVRDAEALVQISATRGTARTDGVVSYPDYVAFRDHTTTVTTLAAYYATAPLFVSVNGTAQEINGAVVSANFFRLLNLSPQTGRFFRDEEDQVPDRDRVAILSDAMWRRVFGASPQALGASFRINGVDFSVIGVAPPGFAGPTPLPIELYIPTMMLRVGYRWCDDALSAKCTVLGMMGRLAPGRTVRDAASEFPTLMPRSWVNAPKGENSGVIVRSVRGMSEDSDEPKLIRNLAVTALLLLAVCCANLAGLLGSQSAARGDEFAIRLSLGAGPRRIVRQVMTEAMLLAVVGGVAGVILARGFNAALAAMFFSVDDEGHPLYYDFSQTPLAIVVTIAGAVAAGLLFSVVPAIRAVRRSNAADVKTRSTTARWWSRRWLLGGQAAIAVTMAAVAALLMANVRAVVGGRDYEPSHVALMRVRPRLVKYTPERAQRFQREVVHRLASLPNVESVSMVGVGAVLGGGSGAVARTDWADGQRLPVRYNEIGPAYFATLRIPVVAGREFNERDSLQTPLVAVVNETLATRLWPNGGAIGAAIRIGNRTAQVVGIVKDLTLATRTKPAEPWAYTPFWQNPGQVDSRIAVRVTGDPASARAALIREVNRVDPDVPIAETITLPIQLAGWMRPLRVSATFIGYTAVLAVLLTATGLYGALAFDVSRRTREIGIRMALGAVRRRVVSMIVRDGMVVLIAGLAAGALLTPGAIGLVSHLLYTPSRADWPFVLASAITVGVVGLFASWLPARRAAAVEPTVALRCD